MKTVKFKSTYQPDFAMTRFGEWCDNLLAELDEIAQRYFSNDMWNEADPRERETMVAPACFAFVMQHNNFTRKTWEKLLGWFSHENSHTEVKLIKKYLNM